VRPNGTPYKQFRDDGAFDAIVIGSGIGGLGSAALLAKSGHRRVLVLEKHYAAGGLTHVFHRPGFEWDVGVHYIGQMDQPDSPGRRLFDYLTEGRLDWQPMPDVYDRVRIGTTQFDYVRGEARLRDALVQAFPREVRAIDRYFAVVKRCLRRMPFFFVEKTLPTVPDRLLGGALRAPFLRLARRTTGAVLDDIGMSVDLKAVLTAQWGDYGLPPRQSSFAIHALVTSHYFDGAAYPVGGASEIASALVPTIEREGGAVVTGACVDRVIVERGRAVGVRMVDGRELRAPCVVSDAGVRTTYERLLPDAASHIGDVAARVRALRPSMGHLCLYVGLESKGATIPLSASNIWVHPSVDFDVFISCPSAKDASFPSRHPGRHTIEVVTLAPYEHFAPWEGTRWHHRGEAYEAVKTRIAARLLKALDLYLPGVRPFISMSELSTPLSTEHFIGSPQGAIYGLSHSPERFTSHDLRPRTPIQGLFLTGQDVATCGVMGALSGAVTTASVILRRNLFSVAEKARPDAADMSRRVA
jgi:phytoene dehydrogenase-like protein